MRELQSVKDIVAVLGGNARTARLTGRKTQHVTNWKAAGRLPPDTFLILSKELETLGCIAPPDVWGIKSAHQEGA